MSTTTQYDALLAQVTDELSRQVLEILAANPQGVSRSVLISKIYGVWVPDNELANSIYDRRVRKAIEALRKDWPIVSNSGEAGYRLSEDADEINQYALEQTSRARHEEEKAMQARRWPAKIRAISEYRKSGVKAEQPRML